MEGLSFWRWNFSSPFCLLLSPSNTKSVQNEKTKTFKIFLFLTHIGYTPKLWLNLQLSVYCLLSNINLNLKLQKENVPKVGGVVNQVSYRRGVQFYAFSVQIFPRSFGCGNFTQIDQILSM